MKRFDLLFGKEMPYLTSFEIMARRHSPFSTQMFRHNNNKKCDKIVVTRVEKKGTERKAEKKEGEERQERQEWERVRLDFSLQERNVSGTVVNVQALGSKELNWKLFHKYLREAIECTKTILFVRVDTASCELLLPAYETNTMIEFLRREKETPWLEENGIGFV
jgi:hypothetical protein